MRLPNLERAFIDRRKLTEYLLAPDHPEGGAKAAFFLAFGFSADEPETLSNALLAHAAHEVSASIQTKYGVKYVIEAVLYGLDGRERVVRSVWVVHTDEDFPTLITAYPLEFS